MDDTTTDNPMTGTLATSQKPQPHPPEDDNPFTLEERIKQLCDIDENIVRLMHHTSHAISSLSPQPPTVSSPQPQSQSQSFKSHMDGLLDTLHEVDVHMKRQILALEEAGIIRLGKSDGGVGSGAATGASSADGGASGGTAAGDAIGKPGAVPVAGSGAPKASLEPNGVGSIGNLDVGWLNSRNSKVERDMEAELWARMRVFLERFEGAGAGTGAGQSGQLDDGGGGDGRQDDLPEKREAGEKMEED